MAITVRGINYSLLSDCDSTSSQGTWSGGDAVTTETDFYKYSSGCIGYTIRQISTYTFVFTPSVAFSITGGKTIRMWFLSFQSFATQANDGIQLFVSDGSDTAYWTIMGGDTYPGGWYPLSIYTDSALTSGTLPSGNITSVGIRCTTISRTKNTASTFVDHLSLNDGLEIYGDDATYDFDDIIAEELSTSNAWGVLRKSSGIYYCVGLLRFGDSVGTNDGTDFKDSGKVIVWEDRKADASNYGITVVDNHVDATQFQLGVKSGNAGISGCVLMAQDATQSILPSFNFSDVNIDALKIYGSSFLNGSTMSFPPNNTDNEVLNTNFEGMGEILVNTCLFKFCNFISPSVDSVLISSESHNFSDNNIISGTYGIEFDTVGTSYYLSNVVFSGVTTDINNTSGGQVIISITGLTNASTYTGSTTLSSTRTLSIIGLRSNTEIRIHKQSDGTALDGIESATDLDVFKNGVQYYKFEYQYDTTDSGMVVNIKVYNLSYIYQKIEYTLTSSNLSIPVSQQIDRNYYNP